MSIDVMRLLKTPMNDRERYAVIKTHQKTGLQEVLGVYDTKEEALEAAKDV